MKISAIAPWFGSKRNLAAAIVEELGPHRAYWEPFCGSMSVLLAKPAAAMETVGDLHGDLINLARVVQCPRLGPQLYRRLRRTLMSETLHREAVERHRGRGYANDGPADADAAYDYFLCAWLGRNGVAGTGSYNQGFCVRYTGNGGHSGTRWTSVIASIPAWRRRLANVTILCRDAFDVLSRIEDSPQTAIYCDPPYLSATRNLNGGFGRKSNSAKYVHDFENGEHGRLAEALRRFRRARIVVSYYEHADLADLYPGWTQRRIEVAKALAHQNRRGANDTRAVEVLLMNGESLGDDAGASRLF